MLDSLDSSPDHHQSRKEEEEEEEAEAEEEADPWKLDDVQVQNMATATRLFIVYPWHAPCSERNCWLSAVLNVHVLLEGFHCSTSGVSIIQGIHGPTQLGQAEEAEAEAAEAAEAEAAPVEEEKKAGSWELEWTLVCPEIYRTHTTTTTNPTWKK